MANHPPRQRHDYPTDPAEVGGKATGLLALPDGWTPEFLVLGREFVEIWQRHGNSASALKAGAAAQRADLLALIATSSAKQWSDGLIVRSNSTGEAHADVRGTYQSIRVPADESRLLAAVDDVLGQPSRDGAALYAIVQIAARTVSAGHLSNERRVAARRTLWMIEEETGETIGPPRRISVAAGSGSLRARTRAEVVVALRYVAFELSSGERMHCEWVWDGQRVWIVQRDKAPPRPAPAVLTYLERSNGELAPGPEPALHVVRPITHSEAQHWSKQRRPNLFSKLGMPTATVYHVDADTVEADPGRVGTDLERLLEAGQPIVIRCDVRAGAGHDDLSLPTSDPVWSAGEALAFMRGTATAKFEATRVPLDARGFLPARLVPARASVMVHARPGAQRIRVDALWGFPDGVGVLTHDTYFHDAVDDRVEGTPSYKGNCLIYARDRGWCFEDVPAPWDWVRVIDEEEIRTASGWARSLADELDSEIQLMVLARIAGGRGPAAMLPWHYTDHRVPAGRPPVLAVPRGVRAVESPDGLAEIDFERERGIHLRPQVGHHRDVSFLIGVGRRASAADVPVYFSGSVLGHPYYLLRSNGAVVIPVGQEEPEATEITYDKLIRDDIPPLVRASGGRARVVQAPEWTAPALLSQKLIEEAFEVANAGDSSRVGELADLMEVVRALCRRTGITLDDIERARAEKRAARGGFDRLTYLEATVADAVLDPAAETAPPLFDDGAAAEPLPRYRVDIRPVEIVEHSERKLVLHVSAVPPLRRAIPVHEYGLSIGAASLRFTHREATLEIVVEYMPAQQLTLPVDTSD